VIIGASEGEREFFGARELAAFVKAQRQESDVPIFLNADHTHSLAKSVEAAKAGFDSVVIDFSALPFDENVARTKETVQATTCTEIVAKFHKPPTIVPDSQLTENHLRLRLSPEITIAMGMMNLVPNAEGLALQNSEMVASHSPRGDEMDAYERVLGAAMEGDSTLFAREDYVEQAWRIVEPVLKRDTPVYQYAPGTWGPEEVERVTPPAGWSNPGEKKTFAVASEAA